DTYRGVETLHHSGGGNGSNAQMLKIPEAGLDIIVMANRSDVSTVSLAERVIDACLPGLDPVKETARTSSATGIFLSSSTRRVVQLFTRDGQQFAATDGFEMPVEPDTDGVFWPAGAFATWKTGITLIGPAEQPSAIRLSEFGNPDELLAQPVRNP